MLYYQIFGKKINSQLTELLLLISALKRRTSNNLDLVLPYLPYSRQDKVDPNSGDIPCLSVLSLLSSAGVSQVWTLDPHNKSILNGFRDLKVSLLDHHPLLIKAVKQISFESLNLVAPDIGAAKQCKMSCDRLMEEFPSKKINWIAVDKTRSGPNKVSSVRLLSDQSLKDTDCFIIDDMLDTGVLL